MKAILTSALTLSICTAANAGTLRTVEPQLRHASYELTATIDGVDTGAAMRFGRGDELDYTVEMDLSSISFSHAGSISGGVEFESINGHTYEVSALIRDNQDLVVEAYLDGALQRTVLPPPTTYDEPITAASLEQLAVGEWVMHDVSGPWHNPGVTVYDAMVEGEHWELTLDRFGWRQGDVMLIPEPSGLVLVILTLAVLLIWRQFARTP